jgi:AcrR family transcriptional regulator
VRGGRPTREGVALLEARIIAEATRCFLRDGFVATTMEAVAAAASVSKRTLYRRYPDKVALLQAAMAELVVAWRPGFDEAASRDDGLETALLAMGRQILDVALTPEALALHRLVVSEAGRVPELGPLVNARGMQAGVAAIADRLRREWPQGGLDPAWAAEQFLHLVVSGPQRRGLGLGPEFDAAAREEWVRRTVTLFLRGAGGA